MDDQLPRYLTVVELAQYFRIGKSTAYELIRTKQIRAVPFGVALRIPREEVQRYESEKLTG